MPSHGHFVLARTESGHTDVWGIPSLDLGGCRRRRALSFAGRLHAQVLGYRALPFQEADLEWELKFLQDEMEGIQALVYNGGVIGLELPTTVTLKITDTQPGIKGSSATARTKPATLETGHVVNVPEFIELGESLTVDTRTGESLGRA